MATNILFPLELMPPTWQKEGSWNGYEQDKLFYNDGGKRFIEVGSVLGGVDEQRGDGRGAALLDIDNDGDLDIVVLNRNMPPLLLENQVGNRRHWIKIRLVGTQSNRQAVGTQVLLHAGDYKMLQEKRIGQGYASCSDIPLFYGLADHTTVDTLEVRWPLGQTQVFHNLPADHTITLTEGSNAAAIAP